MMLVISVIVALAILAVLLNVLNIVRLFNPSDPVKTISSGLKDIQSKGFGVTTPQKVQFGKGTTILTRQVIVDIPIKSTDVTFHCAGSDDSVCAESNDEKFPINVETTTDSNKITVNSNIEANIVVCGNEPKYCVVLGRDPQATSNQCITACGLA